MRQRIVRIALPALAALVAVLVFVAATGRKKPAPDITIVVAAQTLAPGDVLSQADMTAQRIPKTAAEPGEVASSPTLVGSVVEVPLQRGDAILAGDVRPETTAGLSYQVPRGMLAVTVPVTAITGVGGRILAGDRVDVVAAYQTTASGPVGRILFSGAKVLDLVTQSGGGIGGATGPYSGVTIAVTPAQAASLELAETAGSITLALKAHGDASVDAARATEGSP